jgi:hypothetical protein
MIDDNLDMDDRSAEDRTRLFVRRFSSHAEADAADRAYWQSVSPDDRLAMVWDLVLTYSRMQGQDGDQPRLQRSVCRIERRLV